MPARAQFPVLYRGFLTRIIDLDVLSQHGDVSNAIARFASVLAAFSFMFMLGIVPRYLTTAQPRSSLVYALWNDEEFLLSATIAVAGLLAVLAWNSFLPERRDCLVLGSLPIPLRTFAAAKTAAAGTAFAIAVAGINVFTGPTFPLGIAGRMRYVPVAAFGWWLTTAAAALFVFCAVMALQSAAGQLLPGAPSCESPACSRWRRWPWYCSGFSHRPHSPRPSCTLPPEALIALVLVHRLAPHLHRRTHAGARPPRRNRDAQPGGGSGDCNRHGDVRVAAQSTAHRRSAGDYPFQTRLLLPGLAWLFCRAPFDRAVFLFTARTIARSRQHRLLLAVYGGAGISLALTFLSTFFSGDSRMRWDRPNIPVLTVGWLLLFAAVVGTRSLFVLPQDTSANWISV